MDRHRARTPAARRPRRRPSASPPRPPPRARADGRRGRGSCSSTAAAPACRRAAPSVPAGRSTRRRRRLEPEPLELRQALFDLAHPTPPASPTGGRRVGAPRSRRPSGRGGTDALGPVAQLRRGIPQAHVQVERLAPGAVPARPVEQLLDDVGRLAVEPARAVVGPRVGGVVGLARDVQPELLEHLPGPPRARVPSVVRKLPIITPLMPGLDRQRLQLAEVLDAPAAEPEERLGQDQAEDRDPLDGLPRVHELAVAELRARGAG